MLFSHLLYFYMFVASILLLHKSDAAIEINKSGLCVATGIKHMLLV